MEKKIQIHIGIIIIKWEMITNNFFKFLWNDAMQMITSNFFNLTKVLIFYKIKIKIHSIFNNQTSQHN